MNNYKESEVLDIIKSITDQNPENGWSLGEKINENINNRIK